MLSFRDFRKFRSLILGDGGSTSKLQNIEVSTITLKSSLVNFDIFIETETLKCRMPQQWFFSPCRVFLANHS